MLDTFPTGGYMTSLQAFAMGAPVVTLPTQFLGGRLTLAMYEQMGLASGAQQRERSEDEDEGRVPRQRRSRLKEALDRHRRGGGPSRESRQSYDNDEPQAPPFPLVARDEADYVSIALRVANDAALRRQLSDVILARQHRLFYDDNAVKQWDDLLTRAVSSATVD